MQGRLEIQIEIPELYKGIIPFGFSNIAIEHAPLNCRIQETLLAECFSGVTQNSFIEQHFLFITKTANRIRTLFASWMNSAGLQIKSKPKGFILPSGSIMWIVNPAELDLNDLPFLMLERTCICDSQNVNQRLVETLEGISKYLTCSGEMTSADHWFYRFARKEETTLHRFTAKDICQQFSDQRGKLEVLEQQYTREERRRYLDLEDIQVVGSNFVRFARTRLFVKTDRPLESLHPKQRIVAQSIEGTPIVPYYLTKLNKKYLAMKRLAVAQGKKKRFLLLKYRRGGFTTLEQGLSYAQCRNQSYSQCITLAHTQKATQRIFRIAKLFCERDPRSTLLASDSKQELEFADNGSVFFIGTAGGRGVARGDMVQRAHGSEVSKWCKGPNQGELVEDIVAGLIGAASHGEVVLETTPDGYEWFAFTYVDAKKGLNDWVPLFLPWFVDPINREKCDHVEIMDTMTDEEKRFIEKTAKDYDVVITPEQLQFRRSRKKEYGRLFRQEYPEDDITCFITSGMPFFDSDFIMDLLDVLPEYKRQHVPGGHAIYWKEPEVGHKYVVGGDTSEGLPHSDPNGLAVLDKETGEQVATIYGRFSIPVLAKHAIELSKKYNNALLGIERENHGHAVLNKVIEEGYGKSHLRGGPLFFCRPGQPGWDTNGQTRPVMLDELAEAVESSFMKIHDKEFLGECLTFKKQANNKYEADQGCHDDKVIMWSIAWQMRKVRQRMLSFSQV